LKFPGNGLAPLFRAEYNMNHVLRVCVGHVSHLRRLPFLYTRSPALTRWAKFCRASGAGLSSLVKRRRRATR
jgi:hypothetical protein